MHDLAVLVLEDDYLLADDARRELEEAGARVIGPFRDANLAMSAAEQRNPDCAVVDLNLGDGIDFTAARALLAVGVRIIFVTGYDATAIPADLAAVPHLQKPIRQE